METFTNQRFYREFELLLAAGNSKSNSMIAIEKARDSNFSEAREFLKQSEIEMTKAHQVSVELITEEANNQAVSYGVLMMHAQDHLTTAIIFQEMAKEFIDLYERLDNLERRVSKVEAP